MGISVSRQIDEIEVFVDEEKINELGLARGLARLYQVFPVKQGINDRRFPDVRAAGKGNLRVLVNGKLLWSRCADDEFG